MIVKPPRTFRPWSGPAAIWFARERTGGGSSLPGGGGGWGSGRRRGGVRRCKLCPGDRARSCSDHRRGAGRQRHRRKNRRKFAGGEESRRSVLPAQGSGGRSGPAEQPAAARLSVGNLRNHQVRRDRRREAFPVSRGKIGKGFAPGTRRACLCD